MSLNIKSLDEVFGTVLAALIVGVITSTVAAGICVFAGGDFYTWEYLMPIIGGMISLVLTRIYTLNERLRILKEGGEEKIEGTAENWESGKLGMSEEHVVVSDLTLADLGYESTGPNHASRNFSKGDEK